MQIQIREKSTGLKFLIGLGWGQAQRQAFTIRDMHNIHKKYFLLLNFIFYWVFRDEKNIPNLIFHNSVL